MPSYRSHLYRKHKELGECDDKDRGTDGEHEGNSEEDIGTQDDSAGCDIDHDPEESDSGLALAFVSKQDMQRTAALFILKAKEERMLTKKSLDGLLHDITGK